ncbi:YwdI family protein [Mammaliicoccus sciuri]|uniref:YwdI family protein n=1 Tax=Sporosarcina aquimarina TaxID=114975 RepID=UPI001C8DE61C|nr:YwdI family protein [Sporosarcina aquimarina]MBY0221191.1 YwdI family protein [Sporosarcina aquimarina]
MISSDQLLKEMEQQVRLAKHAANEQTRREAVYAVRALCNVLLSDNASAINTPSIPVASFDSAPSTTKMISTLQEQPLREEDANGESLFDF